MCIYIYIFAFGKTACRSAGQAKQPLYQRIDGQSVAQAAPTQAIGAGEDGEELETVASVAAEVMSMIEEKVGSATYVNAYTVVQRRFAAKRDERKRARAAEAIVDPEAAAKRKIQRNLEKREWKKSSFKKRRFGDGNGGKGGDIIFRAVPGLNTLIDFRYNQHFKAQRGFGGMGRDRTGAGGKDLYVDVPIGTQVLADDEDRTLLADLTEEGQEVLLLRGGDGGRGCGGRRGGDGGTVTKP